ncbi:hypothetical protein [Streptomyces sp. NPDC000229]|uniref:hypothetical protein n=1 Tax=Streptomyces sp. NPDC000229 TaxID=3154247 RepID=UPI00332EEE52
MARTVLERFPAGGPRGSWPAEEFAQARRDEGLAAEVVMDIEADAFLVIIPQPRTPQGRTSQVCTAENRAPRSRTPGTRAHAAAR